MEDNFCLSLSLDERFSTIIESDCATGAENSAETVPQNNENNLIENNADQTSDPSSELATANQIIDGLLDDLKSQRVQPIMTNTADPVLREILEDILDLQDESLGQRGILNDGTVFDTPPASNESVDVNRKDILALALEDIGLLSPDPEEEEETIVEFDLSEMCANVAPEVQNSSLVQGDSYDTQILRQENQVDVPPSSESRKVPKKRGRSRNPENENKPKRKRKTVVKEDASESQSPEPDSQSSNVVSTENELSADPVSSANSSSVLNYCAQTDGKSLTESGDIDTAAKISSEDHHTYEMLKETMLSTQVPNSRHELRAETVSTQQQFLTSTNVNYHYQNATTVAPNQLQNNQYQYQYAGLSFQNNYSARIQTISNNNQYQTQFNKMSYQALPHMDSYRRPRHLPTNSMNTSSFSYTNQSAANQSSIGTGSNTYQQQSSDYYSAPGQGYGSYQAPVANNFNNYSYQHQYQQHYQTYSPNNYSMPQQFSYNAPLTPAASPQLHNNQYPERCYSVPPQNIQSPQQNPANSRKREMVFGCDPPMNQYQTNMYQQRAYDQQPTEYGGAYQQPLVNNYYNGNGLYSQNTWNGAV